MNTAKAELELKSALLGTGLLQPISSSYRSGRIEVLCRQIPGQEGPWLKLLAALLALDDGGAPSLHICRRYVLREGELAFGWHIQAEAPARKLSGLVVAMTAVLSEARPQLTRVGADPERVQRPSQPARPGQHPPREAGLRAPGIPADVPPTPPGLDVSLKVIRKEIDEETGVTIIEEEMPLPHVYRELNRPTATGRGAKHTAGANRNRP